MNCNTTMWRKNIESKSSVKFVWSAELNSVFDTIYSDPFELSYLTFEIGIKFNPKSSNSLGLWVRKSTSERAKATICMTLNKTKINVDTSDWKEICYISKNFIVPDENKIWNELKYRSHFSYKLTITCEIFWYEWVPPIVQNEMHSYFNSKKFSDVTIIVGDFKFPAHKVILCEKSPVFLELLQSNVMKEAGTVINIKDLTPKIVHDMLRYFYTGKTEAKCDADIALQMLEAVDTYQIKKLEKICYLGLQNDMKFYNVFTIFDTANDRNAIDLRTNAIKFIIFYCRKIFASKNFELFYRKKPDLMLEIIRATIDDLTKPYTS